MAEEKFKKYISGLEDMLISASPVSATEMPADTELESIGEVKEGGITIAPGSISKENLKKEGPSGPITVDTISTKEADTAKGKLIIRDLDKYARVTGMEVTPVGSGPDKVAKYVGPFGINSIDVAVRFNTATKIGGKAVTRDYPLAKLTVSEDFAFTAKGWWEASIELELLSAGITTYPTPEA